ncbi:hypothetical protein G4V62_19020 [Bacillaceae bacterium SIJ1]|uniref:hypothetical protein n=1 Tax=Litoribacterium kuwaitense TaxID=1398745 RepID=UPI0013EAB0CA|nr:hypothetical protein [Litoribacterium kuwaitense]NGP46917.1 hypothetical protein [Litoribacterium kuwaitense]
MILITDETGRVTLRTNEPTETQRQKGEEVADLPTPESREGKRAVLYLDADNQPYYQYVDAPLSEEDTRKKLDEITQENAGLVMGNASQDVKITTLEQENATLTMKIAQLEANANV